MRAISVRTELLAGICEPLYGPVSFRFWLFGFLYEPFVEADLNDSCIFSDLPKKI